MLTLSSYGFLGYNTLQGVAIYILELGRRGTQSRQTRRIPHTRVYVEYIPTAVYAMYMYIVYCNFSMRSK